MDADPVDPTVLPVLGGAPARPPGLSLGSSTVGGLEVAWLADERADDDAPLALCLHGVPDAATTWRHLLPALTEAGYRPVAPWLRGHAPTAVPADGLYQAGALGRDAALLHEALGGDERAVIIGHDWGAVATYAAVGAEPGRWRRAVGLAVPPPGAMAAGFTSYDQVRKSWYMYFFLHPLAELVVAANDLAFVERLWADWSPGYDPADDLPAAKAALRAPENVAAILGYYRATLGTGPTDPGLDAFQAGWSVPPPVPTLYLHGEQDGCCGVELARGAAAFLPTPGSRVEILGDAGHFLHLEHPATVNALIVDFLAA